MQRKKWERERKIRQKWFPRRISVTMTVMVRTKCENSRERSDVIPILQCAINVRCWYEMMKAMNAGAPPPHRTRIKPCVHAGFCKSIYLNCSAGLFQKEKVNTCINLISSKWVNEWGAERGKPSSLFCATELLVITHLIFHNDESAKMKHVFDITSPQPREWAKFL